MKTIRNSPCALLFILVLLTAAACKKPKPTVTAVSMSMGDFPNKIGDQWIYLIHDSLTNVNDTATVTIISAGNFNGSACSLWQELYSNGTGDTMAVVTSVDTINYYNYNTPPYIELDFAVLFPITASANWKDNSVGNYSVSHLSNYVSAGQNYPDIFMQSRIAVYQASDSMSDVIYIAPKIGLVKRTYKFYEFVPQTHGYISYLAANQTWSLISYHLN